jgi:hypothetical protein
MESFAKKLKLDWAFREDGEWLDFEKSHLADCPDLGVYIIAFETRAKGDLRAVYVGWGAVKERILAHRQGEAETDEKIRACGDVINKPMKLIWAKVSRENAPRVKSYLADRLQPLVGEWDSDAWVEVNLP